MIVDGKALAETITKELTAKASMLPEPRTLGVILVGDNSVSERYIKKKQELSERIGVHVTLFRFEGDVGEQKLIDSITTLGVHEDIHGIIVQLPLPELFHTEEVLKAIQPSKDVDALTPESRFLSPVVRSVQEILSRHNVHIQNKKALVIGAGKLVGKPVAAWLANEGIDVTIADKHTKDLSALTKDADLIVSGAGAPGLVTPEMIKSGVVLIDASTSEANGKLVGDIDPACAEKAALYTPVPGGVGPLTVAMLFANVLDTK